MSGGKLEAAKLASLGLLDRLNSRDRLTVVSFASDVVTHLQAAAMDEAGQRKARSAIGELSTRGMTNLSGGSFCRRRCGRSCRTRREPDPAPGHPERWPGE